MGFSDLFKSTKWSNKEINSLYYCLMGIGGVDGKLEKKEEDTVREVISHLTGLKNRSEKYWYDLWKEVNKDSAADHINVLKSMHKKKRTFALGSLGLVARADGKLDPNELVLYESMENALK